MPETLSDKHLSAWRAVVTSHAAVTDRVQKAFAAADLPPLSWFEVLWAVKLSPSGAPRMSDLAERLTLSRGGITKLVDRLEGAGYIERIACSGDRRSFQAELTPAGDKILDEMRDVYSAEVARHFRTMSDGDAALMAEMLERVTQSTCDARDTLAEPAADTLAEPAAEAA